MCGIAGFQGDRPPDVLARMSEQLRHRGPDDAGEWLAPDAGAGLAHGRLAIIDLSPLAHQPMADASGDAVIAFNGEIYNFRDLRATLEAEGHAFRSQSDTEVLLALYRARGESMLEALNGIFAFAICDRRDRTIFLACDAMGVKPIYFGTGRRGFVFASELKALLACEDIPGALDVAAVARNLAFLWNPGGATPLAGVRRLGPGEALRVKDGRIVRRWRWPASPWDAALPAPSPTDAVKDVERAVRAAVHRQMVADVPVGAFLSGGLDSSAIVAMAREVSPDIECFAIGTGPVRDPGVTDDLPYARRVARHLGVRLHEIEIDAPRMAADLETMIGQLDEPIADPAALNVLYISRLARRHGITVLLSGTGGDDVFAGYRSHSALGLERWWAWMPAAARRAMRGAGTTVGRRTAAGRQIAKAFAYADLPSAARMTGQFLWADPATVVGLLAPEHRAALGGERLTAPLDAFLASLPPMLPPLQRMLALEQRFFLADHNLLYTDKMSMAAGVEVRVPFLDNDLVRLANALPPRIKLRGGVGKWVLKQAMTPYLPREVIDRPKTGFGAPLRHWLHHDLKAWIDDVLSAGTVKRRGLFEPAAVARLVAADRAGRVDAAYTIFALVCIETLCRQFLDGVPARQAVA